MFLRLFLALCLLASGYAEANYQPDERCCGAPVLLRGQSYSLGPATSVQLKRAQLYDSAHPRSAALGGTLRLPVPAWHRFDAPGAGRIACGARRSTPGRQRAPPELS
ncbi:MAG: hypothetical protein ACM336_16805 [Acidobacteriota bacterium]